MPSKENATKEPAEEEQEEERKVQDLEGDALVEEEKELDPIEELQQQLEKKDQEHAEQKGDFLREKADLENFRMR